MREPEISGGDPNVERKMEELNIRIREYRMNIIDKHAELTGMNRDEGPYSNIVSFIEMYVDDLKPRSGMPG